MAFGNESLRVSSYCRNPGSDSGLPSGDDNVECSVSSFQQRSTLIRGLPDGSLSLLLPLVVAACFGSRETIPAPLAFASKLRVAVK